MSYGPRPPKLSIPMRKGIEAKLQVLLMGVYADSPPPFASMHVVQTLLDFVRFAGASE